jgi:hypothetical protein
MLDFSDMVNNYSSFSRWKKLSGKLFANLNAILLDSDTRIGSWTVAYPGIFSGGVQQIQLRTEDKENGDLGAVSP